MNYLDILSTILNGASIRSAKADGDVIVAELTASQASKLQAVDIELDFIDFQGNRVKVEMDKSTVDAVYESNKKAPRASTAVNVDIASRTVYTVRTDGDNEISEAWLDKTTLDDDPIRGQVTINGESYDLFLGEAADYYEIDEDADPTRRVYGVIVPIDGMEHTVTSYGLTNLLRSLARMAEIG